VSSSLDAFCEASDRSFDRSDYVLEIVSREFAISQDLGKKSTPNRLATVYRYYCASAIRMTQEMMTAFRTKDFKTKFPKGFGKL
jgi:hypothetical protein